MPGPRARRLVTGAAPAPEPDLARQRAVAGQAMRYRAGSGRSRRVLVNGSAGMLTLVDGRPVAVIGPTMVDDRIVTIDILDPERLSRLDLCGLDSERSDVEK